ncbi:hypothetical protein [Pseudomonas luteola]|uniref:Universal stress protein n=1 Tax=Pseudomonas luteola TaxID=47886 RepID=A0ABS0MWD6_PSELU|nr:hypothetical protein [Pseudomonas luteola]MBH3441044.1 hypothetical protein [Pseudomonas luteola]
MNRYQRLLFVVDNSCQRTAASKRAQALAQASRAALHLVMFDYVEAIAAHCCSDQLLQP